MCFFNVTKIIKYIGNRKKSCSTLLYFGSYIPKTLLDFGFYLISTRPIAALEQGFLMIFGR